MDSWKRTAWVSRLRPGDKVAVYAGTDRFIHDDIVLRVTKQGRVLTHEGLFEPNGRRQGGGVYRNRYLGPAREA